MASPKKPTKNTREKHCGVNDLEDWRQEMELNCMLCLPAFDFSKHLPPSRKLELQVESSFVRGHTLLLGWDIYVHHSIRLEKHSTSFGWRVWDPSKKKKNKLIYNSLKKQTDLHRNWGWISAKRLAIIDRVHCDKSYGCADCSYRHSLHYFHPLLPDIPAKHVNEEQERSLGQTISPLFKTQHF